MSSDTPRVRTDLANMIYLCEGHPLLSTLIPLILDAERWTHRASPITRPPIKHAPLTNWQISEIWRLHKTHPDMHQQQIATLIGTNAGRVSEIIHPAVTSK